MESKAIATAIVRQLVNAGYVAYFAGGWVRDFIMGHPSEDIDIATEAPPEKIMDLFPHTILVGLTFGIVIVVIEGHQFEIATFRKDINYVDGRRPEQIELSNAQEDAKRRDFTINGMFYDPLKEVIHDFVHGFNDVKMGIIRTIGDPQQRFSEDRLRMIRAIRFAARFGFVIDSETKQAIQENSETLFPAVAMERIWQEFNKMAAYPRFDWAISEMHQLGLLQVIFPELRSVHLKFIRSSVSHFSFFPRGAPVILKLMELFPSATLEKKIDLCLRLKVSKQDIAFVEYCDSLMRLIEKGECCEDVDWAHLYAHPYSRIGLDVIAARYLDNQKLDFLQEHENRIIALHHHIERIRLKKPLVSSIHLKEEGIPPGAQFGRLLKEAERIAVNYDYSEPAHVLTQLKQSDLWPNRVKD